MIRFTLAFVAGVLLFQYQPRLPHTGLFGAYLLLALCAIPVRWCRLPTWLVLGFAWAHGHALLSSPATLPGGIDVARDVWAEGQVDSLVAADGQRTRFLFRVSRLEQDGKAHDGDWRLRVGWYRDARSILPGERWRLKIRLKRVAGYANPGGFDFERWLYEQGIRYRATVREADEARRVAPAQTMHPDGLRQLISDAADQQLGASEPRAAALLRTLVVGDRGGFDQADWHAFRATGTSHLVAISGLHIGLVAGLVMAMVGWLWRRLPWLCIRLPALQAAAVAGWLSALVYTGLAGFAIPTQRALLMLTVGMLALLTGRIHRAVDALALALLLVVAWSPMAVVSAGTWLSFSAVGLILLAVMANDRERSRWKRWGNAQLAVGLGLLPLLILLFQQASLVAPLVNLVAIPWFSLLLVPVALLASLAWLASPGAGGMLWTGWVWLANPVLDALDRVARLEWVQVSLPPPGPLPFVLAMAGAVVLLLPRGVPARWLGMVLLLPLAINRPPAPPLGGMELTLLDVGQGLAAVLRTHGHVLVYDAGPRYRSGFNTGDAVVLPFLRQQGIGRIDTLVISHADLDHAGGSAALRRAMPVDVLLSGEPDELQGARPCLAGRQWHWDGVDFTVLSPDTMDHQGGNNASCVLRVAGQGGSLLLPGDIEARTESRLLTEGVVDETTVVVAPHHGSRSSSTAGFIRALRPRHVLYPVGRDNRWGFPKPDVVSRWRSAGATAWDTAASGAISVRFSADGSPVKLGTYRRRHYWEP